MTTLSVSIHKSSLFFFHLHRPGLSLSEALDILLNNDEMEGDIFIEPPNPSVDTDEDSGDEDGSG
jgi:hypothetical protein